MDSLGCIGTDRIRLGTNAEDLLPPFCDFNRQSMKKRAPGCFFFFFFFSGMKSYPVVRGLSNETMKQCFGIFHCYVSLPEGTA